MIWCDNLITLLTFATFQKVTFFWRTLTSLLATKSKIRIYTGLSTISSKMSCLTFLNRKPGMSISVNVLIVSDLHLYACKLQLLSETCHVRNKRTRVCQLLCKNCTLPIEKETYLYIFLAFRSIHFLHNIFFLKHFKEKQFIKEHIYNYSMLSRKC